MSKDLTDGGIVLPGLDGTNPLGFLAALGVLQVLTAAHKSCNVMISWTRNQGMWSPIIHGLKTDQVGVSETLAIRLKCPFTPDSEAENARAAAQRRLDKLKSERNRILQELKKQGLRGNDRKIAEKENLDSIDGDLREIRKQWLAALRASVPYSELSLGKHLNATCSELREHMRIAIEEASLGARETLDQYAAFGSDVCIQREGDLMEATRFCFITGSGHQYFLGTVRQLVECVTADRIERAIFTIAEPKDEKYSMRWDPKEDRRYAAMWSDPTASSNKAKTNWALNLLAYHGLKYVPSVPRVNGLRTVGWMTDEVPAWNWPIWTDRVPSNVVRSLLSHPILTQRPVDQLAIRALGVVALYQSKRIQVGNPPLHKVNFTPSRRIA